VVEEDNESELVAIVEAAAPVELTELEEQARTFARGSPADSTWSAYDSDSPTFEPGANQEPPLECRHHRRPVALNITALAETRKPSTI
jgi:hypothetical protein